MEKLKRVALYCGHAYVIDGKTLLWWSVSFSSQAMMQLTTCL